MNPLPDLTIPIIFLGADTSLAGRLQACFRGISWGEEYRIEPVFRGLPAAQWRSAVPEKGRGMAFIEITQAGTADETGLIRAIGESNSGMQIVLLADDDADYFQIATAFRIGNVIKKTRFDADIIQALTIRLLT